MTAILNDMHCHPSFTCNISSWMQEAIASSALIFSNSVTPTDYISLISHEQVSDTIAYGCGIHPWYITYENQETLLSDFENNFKLTRFIGEVGLDFSPKRNLTHDIQVLVFTKICNLIANDQTSRLLSIHSIKAEETVLDILEETHVFTNNKVILHWFSGPCEQVHRAIKLGCYFSVGTKMAQSKKGQAYLKLIPADKLLLESDLPSLPGQQLSFYEQQISLQKAAAFISAVRPEIKESFLNKNSEHLLKQFFTC